MFAFLTRQARVDRGCRRLDYMVPGWDGRIDIHKLDIRYRHNCVLGQVLGDYKPYRIGLDNQAADRAHGFYAHHDGELIALTRVWRKTILRRRAGLRRFTWTPAILRSIALFSN
jgi:hypothetical protein